MLEFLGSLLLFFINLYIIAFLVAGVWIYVKFFRDES